MSYFVKIEQLQETNQINHILVYFEMLILYWFQFIWKKASNDFGLIWNFVYMIFVKETINQKVSFKKTLSNSKLKNDVIIVKVTLI